jgi:hypothetical protein
MTTHIDPLQPGGQARPAPAVTRARAGGDFAATLGAARADAAIQGAGPSAPDEVHADMAAASRAWHSLQTSGRELRFDEDGSGRGQITLHQVSGERLAVLDLHDMYALIEAERRG